MKKPDSSLIDSIKTLDFKIRQLRKEASKSETTASLYNRLLIERAVLRKNLEESGQNRILSFLKRKITFGPKKDKLICDYFNG